MNAIELQGIHKIFKPHKRPIVNALTDVDLTVATGDAVALTGHNGAGKTTLLKICATVITPNEGTGKVCGFPFKRHHEIRKHIGLLALAAHRTAKPPLFRRAAKHVAAQGQRTHRGAGRAV